MANKVGMELSLDGEREYKNALKEIVQETKTLNAQMKEVTSAFDDETSSLEANRKQTELLQQKKQNLEKQLDLMSERLDQLRESDEDTTMAESRLEEQIAKVETQLNNTNRELDNHQSAIESLESPMGELEALISDQVSELEDLKDAYANAYLEYGATGEETEALAEKIANLSSELADNQARFEEAGAAAEGCVQGISATGQAAEESGAASSVMSSMFGSNFDLIKNIVTSAGIADLIQHIGGAVMDMAANLQEAADAWETSCDTITIATGAVGDELRDMAEASREAYAASRNMDMSATETAAIYGEVATLFGGTADEVGELTLVISEYMAAAGESADQTENLFRLTKAYGEEAGSVADIADLLTVAAQNTNEPVGDLSRALIDGHGSFQQFGMSMEESVNFMSRYKMAGGDISKLTMGMTTAVKAFTKEGISDIPGAFEKAIETIGEYDNVSEALNAQIEGTGLTIADVFGEGKRGQLLITPFLEGKFAAEDYTEALQNSSGAIEKVMESNTSNLDQIKKDIEVTKNSVGESVQNIEEFVLGGFVNTANGAKAYTDLTKGYNAEAMQSALESGATVQEAASAARATVTSEAESTGQAMRNMGSTWTNTADTISNTKPSVDVETAAASGKLSSFLGSFNSTVSQMRNNSSVNLEVHGNLPIISTVKDAIGGITYSLTGWRPFADAYDRAMIINSPTIFGVSNGQPLLAGDRAGAEVVVGETHLMNMFTDAIKEAFGYIPGGNTSSYGDVNVNVYGAPGQDVKELADLVSKQINRAVNMRRAV